MTRSPGPSLREQRALLVACPTCKAARAEWCVYVAPGPIPAVKPVPGLESLSPGARAPERRRQRIGHPTRVLHDSRHALLAELAAREQRRLLLAQARAERDRQRRVAYYVALEARKVALWEAEHSGATEITDLRAWFREHGRILIDRPEETPDV